MTKFYLVIMLFSSFCVGEPIKSGSSTSKQTTRSKIQRDDPAFAVVKIETAKTEAKPLQTQAEDDKASMEDKAKAQAGLKARDLTTETLLGEHSNNAAVQLAGGGYFTERRNFERAIEAYDKGLAKGSEGGSPAVTVRLLNGKAGAQYAMGDLAGAWGDCASARELDGKDFTAAAICESVLSKLRAMGIEAGLKGAGKNLIALRESVRQRGEKALREGLLPDVVERAAQAQAWANQGTLKKPRTAKDWSKLQEKEPGPAFEDIYESMKARKKGDYANALKRAESAVKKDPGEPMAWVERGLAKNALKDTEGVIVDLSEAVRLGWKDGAVFKLRSDALFRRGSHPELRAALEDLNQVLILDGKDAWAHYARGAIRAKLNYPREQFLEELKLAAELDPASYGAVYKSVFSQAAQKQAQEASTGSGSPGDAGMPATTTGRFGIILSALGFLALMAWYFAGGKDTGSVPAPSGMSPGELAGKTINERFEILRLLGKGGMGTVYEAFDLDLGRKVALKAISPEPGEDAQALLKEARTVASLKHPNIIGIHDAFLKEGLVFQVYELVEGENIYDRIQSKGRLPGKELLDILRPVCEALDFAHGQGVIHRDMKPSNLMIDKSGAVKVLDFGLARLTARGDAGTMTQRVMGTSEYMAPEAYAGTLSRQSDLYSLGVTAYEMLTGKRPFAGSDMMSDKIEGRFPEPASGAPHLNEFFKKAMSPNLEKRFSSARDFYEAAAAANSTRA